MTKETKNLIVFLAIVLLSRQGFAAPILDQHHEPDNYGGSYFWAEQFLAQTFTPSISDQLHHVDLIIDVWTGQPSLPATISIVETVSGEPSGTTLGSVTVPSLTLGWYSFDFLSESVMLTSGMQYGIVLSNDDPYQAEPSDGVGIVWEGNPYPEELFGDGRPLLDGKCSVPLMDPAMRTWVFEPGWSPLRALLCLVVSA